ncbi:MAG: hypothetical protein H7839_11565 [Magnetococcus sp. YQC-5]
MGIIQYFNRQKSLVQLGLAFGLPSLLFLAIIILYHIELKETISKHNLSISQTAQPSQEVMTKDELAQKESRITRAEAALATREAQLAKTSDELAQRENRITRAEAALAAREAQPTPAQPTPSSPPDEPAQKESPPPSSRNFTGRTRGSTHQNQR